ncbi:MAG: hypothetical protein MR291_03985 [Oscillospiraceae bacterium]|nr:hypothetical protein [Oscillospiraceae bacterium]
MDIMSGRVPAYLRRCFRRAAVRSYYKRIISYHAPYFRVHTGSAITAFLQSPADG